MPLLPTVLRHLSTLLAENHPTNSRNCPNGSTDSRKPIERLLSRQCDGLLTQPCSEPYASLTACGQLNRGAKSRTSSSPRFAETLSRSFPQMRAFFMIFTAPNPNIQVSAWTSVSGIPCKQAIPYNIPKCPLSNSGYGSFGHSTAI